MGNMGFLFLVELDEGVGKKQHLGDVCGNW